MRHGYIVVVRSVMVPVTHTPSRVARPDVGDSEGLGRSDGCPEQLCLAVIVWEPASVNAPTGTSSSTGLRGKPIFRVTLDYVRPESSCRASSAPARARHASDPSVGARRPVARIRQGSQARAVAKAELQASDQEFLEAVSAPCDD